LFNGDTKILRDLNPAMLEIRGRIGPQEARGVFSLCIDLQQHLTKCSVGLEAIHAL
jgi:hypothetical protein